MKTILTLCTTGLLLIGNASFSEAIADFSADELSVAKFWEDMGPTLRDTGVEAYAVRYHEEFRHWNIQGAGGMSTKESAIKFWSKFHDDGHRITCTFVKPITVDIVGELAIARLRYEQTITYADGRTHTGLWRMVDVFKRYDDTWRVLESNMVDITPEEDADDNPYEFQCPQSSM